MSPDRLATLLDQPEVQRKILRDYEGEFSLGLTRGTADELAIRVRLEPGSPAIPTAVVLDGESVPLLVDRGFRAPRPLAE